MALTGDLGRVYPSKELKISSFAKGKRWQHKKTPKKNKEHENRSGREKTN